MPLHARLQFLQQINYSFVPRQKKRWEQSVVATFLAANLLFKVRFRRAKIVRNLFQQVLISVPKASNLGRFKKDSVKKKMKNF